jgi:hypothetical protein
VLRRCLHYPPEIRWPEIDNVIDELSFSDSRVEVQFPCGATTTAYHIRWNWLDEGHLWEMGFPSINQNESHNTSIELKD